MNKYYVSVRQFDKVYEPAEGGYFVNVSYVVYNECFDNKEDTLNDYLDTLNALKNEGYRLMESRTKTISAVKNSDGDIWLQTPWAYAVNDYEKLLVEVTDVEPKDDLYEGYR